MRLLDTETGQFVDKDPEGKDTIDAILSHTWGKEGEQTYKELKKIQRRYASGCQAQQSCRVGLEGGPSSSPQQDRGHRPSLPPASSQSPSDSSSITTYHSTAHGRLTQSEVDALVRFIEVYGLTSSYPAPPSSDHPAPAPAPQEMKPLQPESIWDDPYLSPKIRDACAVARKNGYRYIWIDSCCIDKSSSSELSEAINSMYKWYRLADVCYAYLADVPPGGDHHAKGSRFRLSRWFNRGWTLQELIAPGWVEFLSEDWNPIGSKHALVNLVESVTNISGQALLRVRPLEEFSVAQRLSWAAKRKTTREEDRAYSLLGIFDINMSTLYGEGKRAFCRFQEQIMQRIPDQSLFAWGEVYLPNSHLPANPITTPKPTIFTVHSTWHKSPSANSPDVFKDSGNIRHLPLPASPNHHKIEYTFTPYGIRAQFEMIRLTSVLLSAMFPYCEVDLELPDDPLWYLAILSGCEHKERPGYLLGRVCYTRPSKSSVNIVHIGYIRFTLERELIPRYPDLILLRPETIAQFRPHIELKTVYIPHPQSDHSDLNLSRSLRDQPYTAIKLVLLTETRDVLRSRGYTASLRNPDLDHPTTHRLVLSKDEHTLTVTFQHTLEDDGRQFTINAEVKMSRSRVQLDSSSPHSDSDRAGRIVSWSDSAGSGTVLDHKTVQLSAAARTITVDLGLDFAGTGFYVVQVDVQSADALPAPAFPEVESALPLFSVVESAGDKGKVVALG